MHSPCQWTSRKVSCKKKSYIICIKARVGLDQTHTQRYPQSAQIFIKFAETASFSPSLDIKTSYFAPKEHRIT